MHCTTCNYPKTDKGCETPGCPDSIWMTADVRERVKREESERIERERDMRIRNACYGRDYIERA